MNRRIERHRTAFTLIELVVVIAVMGALLCMLLSAVNAAREAGRRIQCAANLGEFARALQDYQSLNGHFPPAMPARANKQSTWSNLWYSPHVQILPYIEQRALAASVNLQKPVAPALGPPEGPGGASAGGVVAWTRLAVFRCSSDRGGPGDWAGNNYRVCAGPGPNINTSHFDGPGPFVALRPRAPADFLDGLSTTVGAAEKLLGSGGAGFSRRADFWYSGAWLTGAETADAMASACGALAEMPPSYYVYSGSTWFFAGFENSWYNHVLAPNAEIPDCSWDFMQPGATVTAGGAFRASSNHPGGVNCMYMDGSVRFINAQLDLAVWRAAATVAGGEAVPSD